MPQEEINRILVREALKGKTVARLKGGDAFVFGRAAEEMTAVRAAGIEVEVIPASPPPTPAPPASACR